MPGVQTCALRSEEHTSELQSHDNLVCRLLLEQKRERRRSSPPRPYWTPGPPATHARPLRRPPAHLLLLRGRWRAGGGRSVWYGVFFFNDPAPADRRDPPLQPALPI